MSADRRTEAVDWILKHRDSLCPEEAGALVDATVNGELWTSMVKRVTWEEAERFKKGIDAAWAAASQIRPHGEYPHWPLKKSA